MMTTTSLLVIGAGPYALSTAALARRYGLPYRTSNTCAVRITPVSARVRT